MPAPFTVAWGNRWRYYAIMIKKLRSSLRLFWAGIHLLILVSDLVSADRYTTYIPDLTYSQATLKNSLKDRSSDKHLHWQTHRHAHQEWMQATGSTDSAPVAPSFGGSYQVWLSFSPPRHHCTVYTRNWQIFCTIPRPAPSRFRYRGGMSGPSATTVLYPRRVRPTVHADSKGTRVAGPLPPLREYKPLQQAISLHSTLQLRIRAYTSALLRRDLYLSAEGKHAWKKWSPETRLGNNRISPASSEMAGGNFYDPGPYYGFNNSNMEPLDEVCVCMHPSLIREISSFFSWWYCSEFVTEFVVIDLDYVRKAFWLCRQRLSKWCSSERCYRCYA